MVNIGTTVYHTVRRADKIYYVDNKYIGLVDVDNDNDDVLTHISDYVMTLTKERGSALGEWLLGKGGKHEL